MKKVNGFWVDKNNNGWSCSIYSKEQAEELSKALYQTAKADEGKLEISLVPTQIIKDIAEVRMYGNKKYGDPDNWKTVELRRYVDAFLRHTLEFVKDQASIDKESGLAHYKHMACNMAFICEMMNNESNPE